MKVKKEIEAVTSEPFLGWFEGKFEASFIVDWEKSHSTINIPIERIGMLLKKLGIDWSQIERLHIKIKVDKKGKITHITNVPKKWYKV